MKILKISSAALLAMLAIVFVACQKDLKSPSTTSDAKGGGGTTPPPAYVYTLPTFGTGCVTDGSYCFDASFTNKGGNAPGGNNSITVSISRNGMAVDGQNEQKAEDTYGNFCFSGLAAGQYTVMVYFRHAGSDNAEPVNVPLSFTLTIQAAENCGGGETQCTPDGVSLTRSSTIVEADATGKVVNVSSTYTVHNCGETNLTKLKLQGGLVNKGSLLSPQDKGTGDATNVLETTKLTGGNTVLTWIFDLPAGGTQNFTIYYQVWGTGCGNPLSGAWSLKNSAGTPIGVSPNDESATQSGYLDRLYWNCP